MEVDMRIQSLAAAGLLIAALATAADIAAPGQTIEVGAKAPDFTLTAGSGESLKLSDVKGDATTVLIFYRGLW